MEQPGCNSMCYLGTISCFFQEKLDEVLDFNWNPWTAHKWHIPWIEQEENQVWVLSVSPNLRLSVMRSQDDSSLLCSKHKIMRPHMCKQRLECWSHMDQMCGPSHCSVQAKVRRAHQQAKKNHSIGGHCLASSQIYSTNSYLLLSGQRKMLITLFWRPTPGLQIINRTKYAL